MNIIGFCDNNKQLIGVHIGNYKVFSKEEIKCKIDNHEDMIIIITSNYLEQIHQQLFEMGMDLDNVFSKFALYYSVLKNIDFKLIPISYRDEFKKKYRRWCIINHKRADYRFSFKYYAYKWENIIQKNPVIIYQPGKVGSVTLLQSIDKCGREVIQTHALAYRDEFMNNEMRYLYEAFQEAILTKQHIKVISGVREPIIRDISYLFEHINLPFVEIYDEFDNDLLQNVQKCLENYFAVKTDNFKSMSPTLIHHMIRINGGIFQWFERELKEVFKIDILEYPFDKEKGYSIITKGNVELLLYKLEKLDDLEETIGDFLDIDNFEINKSNLASNKAYRYTYKQLLNRIRLPKSYIDMYYNDNKYMDYFYRKEEKDDFLKRWKR